MRKLSRITLAILVITLSALAPLQVFSATYDGGGSGEYFNMMITESGDVVPKIVRYSTVVGYTYTGTTTRKIGWIEGAAYVEQAGYQSLISNTEIAYLNLDGTNYSVPNQVTSSSSSSYNGWAKKDINDTNGRSSISLYSVPIFTTADGCSPMYYMPSDNTLYDEIYFYEWVTRRSPSTSNILLNNGHDSESAFSAIEQSFYEAGMKNSEIIEDNEMVAFVNGIGIERNLFEKELNIQLAMDAYNDFTLVEIKQNSLIDSSNMLNDYHTNVEVISPEERVLNRLIETEILNQYLVNSKYALGNVGTDKLSSTYDIDAIFDENSDNDQNNEIKKITETYAKGLGLSLTEYIDYLANKSENNSADITLWKSDMLKEMNQKELDLFIQEQIDTAKIIIID